MLSRFIQVQSIVDAAAGDDITKVKYKDPSCQMSDDKLYIGIVTRVKQRKLLDEGDIDSNASLTFFKGIRSFYHCATEYALSHHPFDDDVLLNAQFVNIQRRVTADFTQVAYFVERFPILLPFCDTKSQEQLFEQFTSYQTMHDSAIPLHIWSDAKVTEKVSSDGEDHVYYRMDTLWAYLSTVKDGVSGLPTFSLLSKVAKLVLTLPHSNADEERVFSLIRQNKTDFRNSLALDGTLSSILTVKMSCQEPCYKFEPTADVIKKSKKATWEYNQAHSSKDK